MSSTATAIKAIGVAKRYEIGKPRDRYSTLRDALAETFKSPLAFWRRNKSRKRAESYLWALRDVSFEIRSGEVVGIVGRNGAGKSTLLKILSRVTSPTCGRIELRGRLGALLEVGTGFHPELTGRENIYLNGAILGMSRHEIRSKYDAILDFAGIEPFVDTPVKRYSSGMYTRLAFAVAAHLEPEVLLVDEVLAVGDIGFQRKCLGKMGEVAQEGRTVIFVSHNLQAIRTLCSRVIVIDQGRVIKDGPVEDGLSFYINSFSHFAMGVDSGLSNRLERTSGVVRFVTAVLRDHQGRERWDFETEEEIRLDLSFQAFETVPSLGLYVAVREAATKSIVTTFKYRMLSQPLQQGRSEIATLVVPRFSLRSGEYSLYIALGDMDCTRFYDVIDENVNLPFLTVRSHEDDIHLNQGYFSLSSRLLIGGEPCSEI